MLLPCLLSLRVYGAAIVSTFARRNAADRGRAWPYHACMRGLETLMRFDSRSYAHASHACRVLALCSVLGVGVYRTVPYLGKL